jgi:peroxiredoxin
MLKNTPPKISKWHVLSALLACSVLFCNVAKAQFYDWAPEYPVGTAIPLLEAPDQNGNIQTLDSLSGEAGLVLVISRSFDWCPFCKAQLKSLVEVSEEFRELGFGIATLTYDPPDMLKLAESDFAVNFPLLRDINRKHVEAFGILNKDYSPGDFAYGIPEPGIMLIDPQGTIQVKFAEENFRERPDWADVIEAAGYMGAR